MASNVHVATTYRNTRVDAIGDALDSGTIKIYDGTQPANANTSITSQTLLVTLTFNASAFPAASSGSSTAAAITSGVAVATGTAAWARIATSGAATVFDCSVGTSSADIIVPTTA